MDAISIFGIDIYWQGVVLGLCTFLVIGIFHPLVVKAEYYFGTRSWWVFLVFGIICGVVPFFISSLFWGALSAIVGFSSLWSIGEIFDQRKRVIKGWFPMNPKRGWTRKTRGSREARRTEPRLSGRAKKGL